MFNVQNFKKEIFHLKSDNFEDSALALFHYQAQANPVYQKYLNLLKINHLNIKKIQEIPFIPINFFKTQQIISGNPQIQKIFESSGTTGQITSKHFVADIPFYQQLSQYIFEKHYGSLTQFHILGLLPSYLERQNSSLVEMVNYFIQVSKSSFSGFYLHNLEDLAEKLKFLNQQAAKKTLLIGVTFGLLDLAENYPMDLSNIIVMETGGMKGRRQEMIRSEVHEILKSAFNLKNIHSEYGMTELLSQGYSTENELFNTPEWLKIYLRDPNDPFDLSPRKTGVINVIDLANVDSCAFIATQDLGEYVNETQFKVLGRTDNSDIRGCNLMVL